MDNQTDKPKKEPTRANRNTPEADVEENSQPFDEIGKTEEEIRRENQGKLQPEPAPKVGSVPIEGS